MQRLREERPRPLGELSTLRAHVRQVGDLPATADLGRRDLPGGDHRHHAPRGDVQRCRGLLDVHNTSKPSGAFGRSMWECVGQAPTRWR